MQRPSLITSHKRIDAQSAWLPWKNSPTGFASEHDVICMEYPFRQRGSAVLSVSPPSLLPNSSLLTVGAEWETEKALMLCKQAVFNSETLVCY